MAADPRTEPLVQLARHEVEITNLKGWQKTQNGSLGRLEERLSHLDEKVDARFDRLNWFLVALMGGMVVDLGMRIMR